MDFCSPDHGLLDQTEKGEPVKSVSTERQAQRSSSPQAVIPPDTFELVTDILADMVLEDLRQQPRMPLDNADNLVRMVPAVHFQQGHA